MKSINSSTAEEEDSTCRFTSNDDVLIEILLHLPGKSLSRFKSVSKSWLSLISSDQFLLRFHTRHHSKLQPYQINSFYPNTHPPTPHFYFNPLPSNFTIPNPKILSSCKGLLLIQSHHHRYSIFNPTTKESRKLTLTKNPNPVAGLNLVYEPSKSPHFKIICLRKRKNYEPLNVYQIEVYNSEKHTWKLCVEEFTFSVKVFSLLGVHCNDCIYWPSYGKIPYFDIAKNVIKYMPCPRISRPSKPYISWSPNLQVLNHHLCYFVIDVDFRYESVRFWDMLGDNDDPDWFYNSTFCWHLLRCSSQNVTPPLKALNESGNIEVGCVLIDGIRGGEEDDAERIVNGPDTEPGYVMDVEWITEWTTVGRR